MSIGIDPRFAPPLQLAQPSTSSSATPTTKETSFADALVGLVQDTNRTQQHAEAKAEAFAVGDQNDIHSTLIGLQEADIKFKLVANIRNKIVDAYREVMRMGT